jgi:hypothetical protein
MDKLLKSFDFEKVVSAVDELIKPVTQKTADDRHKHIL